MRVIEYRLQPCPHLSVPDRSRLVAYHRTECPGKILRRVRRHDGPGSFVRLPKGWRG